MDQEPINANEVAEGLSDAALELCLGWFSFGSKATVNIGAPYANLEANKDAINELLAAGHIVHSFDSWRKVHTYKGTVTTGLIRTSDRAKAILMKRLGIEE